MRVCWRGRTARGSGRSCAIWTAGLATFGRAVTAEPDLVAAWADFPTFHADLTARHKWE